MRRVHLLRAVNVGGAKLPMAELREVAAGLGATDVSTYIASGNLICTPPGDPADFDRQLEALREALALAPSDPDRLFMLGYVLYYTGQRGEAYSTLAQVVRANPKDEIASRLMRNAQPPDIHRSE